MPKLKLDIQRFAGEDGTVIIGVDLDTKSFDAEIEQTEKELERLEKAYSSSLGRKNTEDDAEEFRKLAVEIEKTKNKLVDLKNKQKEIDQQNFTQMKESIENVGNSISKTIKKVIKWGLAIFSVRSAYMLVRQVASSLANTNEQIGADIQYIRYALASALQPIIEKIIDLVYKLLAYVNYISMAWFKVNLFANATTKSFQSANKGAKELKKTLAGFDEMNILNKDGSVNASGAVPSMDLSKLENIEIPDWIDTIAKNGDKILKFFTEFVKIIATAKIASFVLGLTNITTALKTMSGLTLFTTIATVALTLVGIYETISSIIKFIGNPTWDNFADILSGVAITLAGIGATMILINASNPLGWITLAIGGLTAIIGGFFNWGNEAEETTRKLKGTKEATDELIEAQDKLANRAKKYTRAVDDAEEAQKDLSKAEKETGLNGKELFNMFQLGILTYDNMNESQKRVLNAYIKNTEAQENLNEAVDEFTVAQKGANIASGQLSGAIYEESQTMDDYFSKLVDGYQKGKIETKTFYQAFNAALANMSDESKKTFVEGLPQDIKDGLFSTENLLPYYPEIFALQMTQIAKDAKKTFGTDIPNEIEKGLASTKIQNALSKFSKSFSNAMSALGLDFKIDLKSGNISKNAKGAIVYPSMLPKLAVGGIINQPGRGVPLGVGGERGAEGVIPLTDSQQMELLGETIGRYITVNLTNVTKLDSRQIARKVDKVQQNNSFIFNR